MKHKTLVLAVIVAGSATALAVGCNSVLGFKDPRLGSGSDPMDAAIDTPPMIDAMIDASNACPSSCDPFGCETGTTTCRPKKVWVFLTTGSFFGDGIGGRAGADAKCFTTASASFAGLGCVAARTHAVITIDAGDDIQSLAAHAMIPNVEVHRADDDATVFNSWTDLITTGKAPLTANVVNAASDAAGVAWTGFGPANTSRCTNWTSKLSTDFGAFAATRNPSPPGTWLAQAADTCNLLHRLFCVCWAGG